MFPYLLIILFMVLLRVFVYKNWLLSPRERKSFIILSLLPIFILSGFRGDKIGADTEQYKLMFSSIAYGDYNERIEIGYIYLNKLIFFFTSEPQWLLVITALFFVITVGLFIYKNAKDPFLALLFFVTLGLFQFSLSGLRQTIAISITLLSIEFIKKRKLLWFILVVIIASFFHKSAILFLPSYIIGYRNVTLRNLVLYLLLFTGIYIFSEVILLTAADFFELNYGIEETNNGRIFFSIVLLITVVSFISRKSILNPKSSNRGGIKNVIFYNLNFVSLLLWAIRLVSRTAERVTFYFMPSTYLLLEEYIMSFSKPTKRLFLYVIISILSISLFVYRLSGDTTLVPYTFSAF